MSNGVESVDCVVIGAGVVGLAVARALALQGREVMVLEAAHAIGTGTSSRNSEVIHAGIYYPTGSLKAQLCVAGNQMLYAYCAERGIDHRRCGKLIVASSAAQADRLNAIARQAVLNGVVSSDQGEGVQRVDGLRLLSRSEALALEPQLECVAALHSPSTGIVDSHALMLSLQGDVEACGGILVLNCTVAQAKVAGSAIDLIVSDGTVLRASTVVNAAGLSAQGLALQFSGLASQHVPGSYYAKGNYFSLAGRSPFDRLIYPVPEAAGLGVHATLDLGGQVKFGPDVQWVDSADDLTVDPARGDAFYAEVRKYWPGLPDGALQPSYAGIRPKLQGAGLPSADFLIQGPADHGVAGLVNLFGIESPGLTASLAIGQAVAAKLARAV
jgi:L-2-hydroxyglutarate oxidase LhgO